MSSEIPNPDSKQNQRVWFGVLSIAASIGIVGIKIWAYWTTDSAALRSDALENSVNIVASIFALIAIAVGSRPADRGHPYGHGKIEFFSAAFEGGLISIASMLILYGAIQALVHGETPHDIGRGLLINLVAGCMNGLLGYTLIRAGRQLKSHALEADGHHILSDFLVTVGLATGLLAVRWTGFTLLDPLMAMGIALLLIRTGFRLVRESSGALLDSEDPELIATLVEVFNRIHPPDILTIHELRAMRSGRYVHVDMHVVVPEFYEVGRAHDLVEDFGQMVITAGQLEGECHTHTDPCRQLYCEGCRVEPCPVRRTAFQREIPLTPSLATAVPADI